MGKVGKNISKMKGGRVSKFKSTPKKTKNIEEKRKKLWKEEALPLFPRSRLDPRLPTSSKKKDDLIMEIEEKMKKQLTLVPRLRLEPQLTPAPSKKNDDLIMDIEKNKRLIVLLDANEVNEHLSYFNRQNAVSHGNSHSKNGCNQGHEVADTLNTASTPKINYEIALNDIGIQPSVQMNDDDYDDDNDDDADDYDCELCIEDRKPLRKCAGWNDRELKDLAYGLQSQGFADLKKVADIVKTKNENDVREYIKPRCWEARKANNRDSEKQCDEIPNKWAPISHGNLATWPNVRKWRKLAYEQMLVSSRTKDYSRSVIVSLCKRFYEEEPEPPDPQVINTKLIYKYMMDCMAGKIPPQLPPKESALVLDMLREVRMIPFANDFEEERKFLKEFRTATTFKPFGDQDEFKKRVRKDIDDGPNTVSVPDEVFENLSRHKKLVQSFNPLVTPVWMLQKEQELLEKYSEEEQVYID